MPIDPDFPKNHKVMGKHSHAMGNTFTLYGDPEDQTLKPQQDPKFRKHTRQGEKNMFL